MREGERRDGILIVPMHYFSHREWERERRECHHASGIIYCFRGVMKNICIIYVNIHFLHSLEVGVGIFLHHTTLCHLFSAEAAGDCISILSRGLFFNGIIDGTKVAKVCTEQCKSMRQIFHTHRLANTMHR